MSRCANRWWSLVLLALAGNAAAVMPEAAQFARDIEAGRVDIEQYDFATAGYWDLDESARRTWFSNFIVALGVMDPESYRGCGAEALRREAAMVWTGPLHAVPDAAGWSAAVAPLRARLAEFDAFVASTKPAQTSLAAQSPRNPRVGELLAREAREQAMRGALSDARWTRDLPPLAASWWMGAYSLRYGRIDCPNTEWLRRQLAEIGWFDIPTYGAEADRAAWLLVQHADRTPEFQREVLARLETLPAGKTASKNLAYLADRVARAEGRPQRYGTQGTCQPDGSWQPDEVEDAATLDAHRKSVGLEPISEHAPLAARACPKPPT